MKITGDDALGLEVFRQLVAGVEEEQGGVLITVVNVEGSAPRKPGARLWLKADGTIVGTVGGGEVEAAALAQARAMLEAARPATKSFEHATNCGGSVTFLLEAFPAPQPLIVIGAGHVGRRIAELAGKCGFAVTVVARDSDRVAESVLGFRIERADEPAVLHRLNRVNQAHVIVATGSQESDAMWSVAALKAGVKTVGVVGSTAKARAIDRAMEQGGISHERAALLRCPVGLDIKAETPAEIAVAIVAELILLRRSGDIPKAWRKNPPD